MIRTNHWRQAIGGNIVLPFDQQEKLAISQIFFSLDISKCQYLSLSAMSIQDINDHGFLHISSNIYKLCIAMTDVGKDSGSSLASPQFVIQSCSSTSLVANQG